MPGLIPKNYEMNQTLDFFVGQLETPHSSFTFDFYMLNWCTNKYGKGYEPETFGTTLRGTP
jgi:hypothetical protein